MKTAFTFLCPVFLILFSCRKSNHDITTASTGVKPDPPQAYLLARREVDSNGIVGNTLTFLNTDGSVKWKRTGLTSAHPIYYTYGNNTIFFSSSFYRPDTTSYGIIYAIDINTGNDIWTYKSHSFNSSPPVVSNGLLYTAQLGALYAQDTRTGDVVKMFPVSNLMPLAPAIDSNIAYVLSANYLSTSYVMSAVDLKSWKILWAKSNGLNYPSYVSFAGNLICFINGSGNLVALNKSDGTIKWTVNDQRYTLLCVKGDNVYVANLEPPCRVYAFDLQTGLVKWSSQRPLPIMPLSLFNYKNTVSLYFGYIISPDLVFGTFNAANGDSLAFRNSSSYYSQLILAGTSLYGLKSSFYDINAGHNNVMILDPETLAVKDSVLIPKVNEEGSAQLSLLTQSGRFY